MLSGEIGLSVESGLSVEAGLGVESGLSVEAGLGVDSAESVEGGESGLGCEAEATDWIESTDSTDCAVRCEGVMTDTNGVISSGRATVIVVSDVSDTSVEDESLVRSDLTSTVSFREGSVSSPPASVASAAAPSAAIAATDPEMIFQLCETGIGTPGLSKG